MPHSPHPLRIVIGALLLGLLMLWMLAASGDLESYLSLPAAIIIVVTLLGAFTMTYGLMALLKAIGHALGLGRASDAAQLAHDGAVLIFASRMSWGGGIVGSLITAVSVARDLDWDWATQALATLAPLPLLYGGVLAVFLFTPLRELVRLRAGVVTEGPGAEGHDDARK